MNKLNTVLTSIFISIFLCCVAILVLNSIPSKKPEYKLECAITRTYQFVGHSDEYTDCVDLVTSDILQGLYDKETGVKTERIGGLHRAVDDEGYLIGPEGRILNKAGEPVNKDNFEEARSEVTNF